MKKILFLFAFLLSVVCLQAQSYWNNGWAKQYDPIVVGCFDPADSIPKNYKVSCMYYDTCTRQLKRLNAGKSNWELYESTRYEVITASSSTTFTATAPVSLINNGVNDITLNVLDRNDIGSITIKRWHTGSAGEIYVTMDTVSTPRIETYEGGMDYGFIMPANMASIELVRAGASYFVKSIYWLSDYVSSTALQAGAVTTPKINDDAITFAKIGQNGATTGQAITWNGTDWAATALPKSDIDSISPLQGYHGFRNKLQANTTGPVILLIGDSRIEHKMLGNDLKRRFINRYGNGGIGFFINWDYYPSGVTNANNSVAGAFTAVLNSGDALYSFYGKCNTITTAQTTIGPVFMETSNDTLGEVRYVDVYSLRKTSGGVLRFRAMDKTTLSVISDVTISTTGTNNSPQKTTIDLGAVYKNLRFEYTCVAGGTNVVTLLPCCYRRNTTGALVLQCGQGSRTTADFSTYTTNVGSYFASQIKPNLLIYLCGVNDASASVQPSTMQLNTSSIISTYRTGTGANYFSAIILGETGTRITDEYEDRINSAYYVLSENASKTYISFINLKDIARDWSTLMAIPSWTWALNDNVHWGTRGAMAAGDYIWQKLTSASDQQNAIFPRKYVKLGLASVSNYDVASNAPTTGTNIYSGELGDYVTISPSKVRVVVNGIERVYNASNTSWGWSYSTNTITAYDGAGSTETIKTISVEILP